MGWVGIGGLGRGGGVGRFEKWTLVAMIDRTFVYDLVAEALRATDRMKWLGSAFWLMQRCLTVQVILERGVGALAL